jgi:hypothetical protein
MRKQVYFRIVVVAMLLIVGTIFVSPALSQIYWTLQVAGRSSAIRFSAILPTMVLVGAAFITSAVWIIVLSIYVKNRS